MYTLIQTFVNEVRRIGGNNLHRLLLISALNADLEKACSEEFKLPKDPSNKLAVYIHLK